MANNGNMNPGAFQFIPGQGFVPSQPAQPQGAPAYNPYAQEQGGYPGGYGGYNQGQPYGQQGGYGGYQGQPAYGQQGFAQGGYVPPQARQGGFNGQQTFQPRPQQAFQPRQPQQFGEDHHALPAADQKPAGPAKTVSLSIGGGSSSAPVPKSNEPRKVISLGAKKPAETTPAASKTTAAPAKSMSISIGGKKLATEATASSTANSRTTTPVPAAKKEEKAAETADWEEPEPVAPVALASEVEKPAAVSETKPQAKVSSGTTNFTRASAKTDTDAIAKEAATAADEETLKELYGGDVVDPNGECLVLALLSSVSETRSLYPISQAALE